MGYGLDYLFLTCQYKNKEFHRSLFAFIFSMRKIIRFILWGGFGMIIISSLIFHDLIYYGIKQGIGQLSIVFNAKPVEEVLKSPDYSDTIKNKLLLIEEIRQFAFDSLGINFSKNYTSFYDQKGQPLLWVVTASDPFALKAKEWDFPILGSFTYKGFFDYSMALDEEARLKRDSMDTSIDEVQGWSTLGWFKDPVLSSMLERTEGSLANLIIHELTHGTLYVKDNVQFNENLASFVGDKGAQLFLASKFGVESDEYADYLKRKNLWEGYAQLVLQQASVLDSLYSTFSSSMAYPEKKIAKYSQYQEIIKKLKDHMHYFKEKDPDFYNGLDSINNAYFLDFRTYREDQNIFEMELKGSFNGNFREYLKYLKEKYPSL